MKKNGYTTETPVFFDKLDVLETTDPGHADILNPINKQLFENTLYLRGKMNEYIGSIDNPDSGIGFVEGIEAENVVDAINEVFQLGSEKKNKLVENLTVMGIKASADETWEELLDKVLDMTDTSKDTVNENVLLAEYTAHSAEGELITGIMPERASVTVDTTGVTQDDSYTYFGVPEGHYNQDSKVRAINSDLSGVYYLGTGTRFDLRTKFPNNYNKFTANNFIVEAVATPSFYPSAEDLLNWCNVNGRNITKSYSNGILTINGAYMDWSAGGHANGHEYSSSGRGDVNIKVYLVSGKIK